jgi:hypothetical protein
MPKKIIFLLLFLPLLINAQNEQGNSYGLYLNLIYDGEKVSINTSTDIQKDVNVLFEPLKENGNYYILYKNFSDKVIYRFRVDLKLGVNEIIIPYKVNAKELDFYDQNNRKIGTIDVSDTATCNENGICEGGEENLCPLDCKNVKNPDYPLPQTYPSETIKTQKPSIPPTTAKQTYIKLIIYSILLFLIIFIIFAIIYRKKK